MLKHTLLYWFVQIISWGILCSIIGVSTYIQGEFNDKTAYKIVELYISLLIVSHFIRWVFIKKEWLNLKLTPLIPRILSLVTAMSLILMVISNTSNTLFYNEEWLTLSEFLINTLLYSIFLIMWSAVYLTYHLLQKSRLQEINNLKLQTSQTQNELKTLRDQLNPHFLFNSLNSIRALIEIEPKTAKSAITTLSSLLRNSLILGKRAKINLKEELQLVEEYLRLEKIRFEERLKYTLNNEIQQSIHLPPFLLQSLVENALKHGISQRVEGGEINIKISIENNKFVLNVINDGIYNDSKESGIGIKNSRRRLEIIYGQAAGYEIKNKNGKVHACIWINQNQL
ncbi:sensor histidine kinase [Brumimicrobium aurantiacum]|uniref:Signal transduction histidine kinase internal region domain-containing protein n=1 Tax=Brumimicrobium aurantiacum TaxID=1737063 RepID=A0A3E1EZX6_9FLAO|nr:histidine kinase [Brumimicrobium aurantiacum]RFC55105.1 hypothetical protein DXU93_04605 [Brumimicrobium aurantiacum]